MLDSNQEDIVTSKQRNILVIASPGSGKTTVIINRAGHLITNDKVEIGSMVVITFTRAAADNMRQRFCELFPGVNPPFFGTFHSFFYNLLRVKFGKINVIGNSEAFAFVKGILKKFMDEIAEERVSDALNCISAYKSGRKQWEQLEDYMSIDILKHCYNEYENYKSSRGLLDFDDLQLKCLNMLREDKASLELFRKRFKYFLVDEFQDCDEVQLKLLKMLCLDNSIFAVGDEDQCIYGFRGARPDYMVNFECSFEGSVKMFLTNNYRSVRNIVELSGRLIQNNKMRNKKLFKAVKETNGVICCERFLGEREQADRIVDTIIQEVEDYKSEFKDYAVLYRTNNEAGSLIDALIKKKVPFTLIDGAYSFFGHFICLDILCYMRLCGDLCDRKSFLRVINKPFRYISKVNLQKLNNYKFKEDCFDILCNIPTLPAFQFKELHTLRNKILKINKISVSEITDYILKEIGYGQYLKEFCSKNSLNINDMLDILESFRESLNCFKTLGEFLEHVKKIEEELNNKTTQAAREGVLLSTIHGVKGMEFKNVYIINCVDGINPYCRGDRKNDIEEERRLFYVGITRAMENLRLCLPMYIRSKQRVESPFLSECGILITEDIEKQFPNGCRVVHNSFGEGIVLELKADNIKIKFHKGLVREFNFYTLISHNLLKKLA